MIKLFHTADLHLDSPFPSLGREDELRRNDFILTFDRLLHLAIKNDVDFFLLAGDLFNSPTPSSAIIGKVQSGLQRLSRRGITPVILPGTHDHVFHANSVYRRHEFPGTILLDGPFVETPVSVEKRGHKVHFYGFAAPSTVTQDPLPSLTRQAAAGFHIGLLHGSRKGSPGWAHAKKDLPFSLEDLKQWRLDYVALGHYHNFEILQDNGRPLACYPGTPEGKKFGENGCRYAALVTLREGSAVIDRLTVNSRILEEQTLDLSGYSDLAGVKEDVLAFADPKVLLRLTLKGLVESALDLDLLHAQVCDSFFHLEIVDRTSLFDSHFAHRIAGEETVRGCFVRRVQKLMATASPEEKNLLEKAFREVLTRFQADGKERI